MSVKTKNQTVKLNKVNVVIDPDGVSHPIKVDKRKNNPGRPVNKKSARYIRLQKQSFYSDVNSKFKKGNQFEVNNKTYRYTQGVNNTLGSIFDVSLSSTHACDVTYIGRTKVTGYTSVLGKRVNVELNLKTLKFVK